MASLFGKRMPRFRRETSRISPMQITARDREILRYLLRYRFLRSSHIIQLLGGSRQQLLRRLHLLFHHGYVVRPRCQIDYFHVEGSRPIIYGLSNKGIKILQEDQENNNLDWTTKNSAVKRLYLQHSIMTSDILVMMELAFRDHPHMRYLSEQELFPLRSRFSWKCSSGSGKTQTVVPDAVFAIEDSRLAGPKSRCYYFLEADTGSMPITRHSRSSRTCLAHKLEMYSQTWKQGILRDKQGIHRFLMLTVTHSPSRANWIAKQSQKLPQGNGIVRVTDLTSLQTSASDHQLLLHPWWNSQLAPSPIWA